MIKTILDLQRENDQREKQGKPRRQIFCNIHGINAPGKKPLKDVLPLPDNPYIFFGKQDNPDDPPPKDYFVPPLASIFIFDECQKFDWIQQKSGALSKDLRVKSLEEHRHAGHDIYFVTQSPNYIHSHIQGLVAPHYYLERPLGLGVTNVFMHNKFQARPESATARKNADDHFTIQLGKKYGAYYQSSAEHNIKAKIPKKVIFALAFFIFILCLFVYKFSQTKEYYEDKYADDTVQTNQINETSESSESEHTKIDHEKIYLEHQQQQEIAMLMRQIEQANRRIELLESWLPKDYEVIKNEPILQVRGVIKMSDHCKAYNTHGDLMTLSLDECNYYISEPGRVHKSDSVNPVYPDAGSSKVEIDPQSNL